MNMILSLLKDVLPEGNILPPSLYRARKLLSGIGLGYTKIDACKYDCALFWKENENEKFCPICKEPRWKIDDGKGKRIPHKVLWYFPLKPRLQRLYMSSKTASYMRWHAEKRIDIEGSMSHPADSPAWKDFNLQYPDFASDPRNVRFGLATDGFNPFGNMSLSYSMWPVILIPYNMPLYKCMKDDFFLMPLLIPGPRAPGKDIDIYLRPLIDELRELWIGVEIYDAFSKEPFQLRASILWTINDLPALSNLLGWITKGYEACPCCFSETDSKRIRSKICYTGHRRYLDKDHPFRKSKLFDGKVETRSRPREMNGAEILSQLDTLKDKFDTLGKHPSKRKRKRSIDEGNWVKKSIFFELPYWHKLKIRHNLDVMHVEKNICDNVLGTLLNIEGKTKDTEKAREDLRDLNIRKELHLQKRGNTTVKPKACYNLSSTEKKGFYDFLRSVKFPDGYAANISRCVKEGKISGLKTHDCHVLLQRLIPAGVRGYLHKNVTEALFELGEFFNVLCSKTLRIADIEKMERNIPLILCKLEKIFPPAFFDVMIHLAIHLPQEAKVAGPVHSRWMYPIERFLKLLKSHVRNKARPEGSIAEGYIVKECLTFMSMYLHGIETKFNRTERNYDGVQDHQEYELTVFALKVRPLGPLKRCNPLSQKDIDIAQNFILNNCVEVDVYKSKHLEELKRSNVRDVQRTHQKQFRSWFKDHINRLYHDHHQEVSEELWSLANGPQPYLTKFYSGCIVNEIRFHSKDRDDRRTTQNSGLVVEGDHQNKTIEFFGFLSRVVELTFLRGYKVVLFQCEWFNTGNQRTMQNDKHFVTIDVRSRWYQDDPFVLPNQVHQVFYINDTKLGNNWRIVQRVHHRHLWDLSEKDIEVESISDDEQGAHIDAFQRYESSGAATIVENEDIDLDYLAREDVEADVVDENVLKSIGQPGYDEDDIFSEEENDETLVQYSDDNGGNLDNIHDGDGDEDDE
ncbi:hypothetical protein ACJIZ3_023699 [Penstemon smallii]|uniref:DUF4218 domain-containing protein n=1 Tax=Penstemon smallii TaxID=265156 RepID=A0ABD3TRR0_9LAMI